MTKDKNSNFPVAITMGDPAGIGPELCLRLLNDADILKECTPVVFGDQSVMKRLSEQMAIPFDSEIISLAEWMNGKRSAGAGSVVDCDCIDGALIKSGEVDAGCGAASFAYINSAIDAALAGQVCAVVTAPIHKEAFRLAGIDYAGHTEIFAERASSGRTCMMLTSDELTISLVTTHMGYGEVVGAISNERIVDVIELTHEAMLTMRGRAPRIAVCALNPHAGEHGLFGAGEEESIIMPAIEAAKAKGIDLFGPLPPDTAFVPALLKDTDAVVCMYHDQGLIPFKMIAFDKGVNITLGLSIVRTSVDHGTAFDIAWQGVASPDSLYEAVRLGVRLGGCK